MSKSAGAHLIARAIHLVVGMTALVATPVSAQHYSHWSTPENLGSVVNTAVNDQHPAISPDDLALYFVSDRAGGVGSTDIWVTRRQSVEEPWGTPVPLPSTINTGAAENAPTLGGAGHLLLFGSERVGGCGGRDIWVSFRRDTSDDFAWESPVNLGCALNFGGFDDGPTWFEDDNGLVTIYFTSLNRAGGMGDFDIWSSTLNADSTFSPAINIAELNSSFRDTRTAIRRDGLELYYTSQRPGSLADTLDLWVSTRTRTHGTWSVPANVGAPVNGTSNDGAPALSREATTLYFYSNRPGGSGANDLYVTRRIKIHRGQQR